MSAFFRSRPHKPAVTLEPVIETPKKSPGRCTVLVTGGTEGIGSIICRRMKEQGYIVAATYRDENQARQWQDRMELEGYLFYIYPCKLESFAESQRLVKDAARDLGSIDVLVNAAGMGFEQGHEMDSAFNITCSAMEGMLNGGYGRIINISFMNAAAQRANVTDDGGLHRLTQKLAPEVAKRGITVNTISPGAPKGRETVGRFKKPEDVADVVSFLASEDSSFITGVNIPANGETEGGIFDERF